MSDSTVALFKVHKGPYTGSYTVHATPLEHTTATFKPTALRFDMISSTTVDFPVPAWPVISELWPLEATLTICA